MQLEYDVKADRSVDVLGLGHVNEGETRTFTEAEVANYTELMGMQLNQGSMPEGAILTVRATTEKEGE
jgi:hypothetical protein